MHTTSRLGLDVADSSDNVSAYPAVNAQAMGVLDGAVTTTSGTLAARPSASSVAQGNQYYATDTSQLFMSTGSVWQTVPLITSAGSSQVLQLLSSQQLQLNFGTQNVTFAGPDTSVSIAHGLGRVPKMAFAANDDAGGGPNEIAVWSPRLASATATNLSFDGHIVNGFSLSGTVAFYWFAIG